MSPFVKTPVIPGLFLAQVLPSQSAMMIASALLILAFVFYVMNAEERVRALRPVVTFARYAARAAARGAVGMRLFIIAVRARKRWALTTLGTAALLVLILIGQQLTMKTFIDVKPEIERLIAIEDRTATAYQAAVNQFKLGALSAEGLSRVITRSVVPELQAVRLRLKSLDRVSDEHRPLLTRAEEYLRLRSESWRMRAEALQKRNMTALKKADRAERASLEAFEQIRNSL